MSVPLILGAADISPNQSVHLSYTAGKPAPQVTAKSHAGETLRFTLEQGNEDLAVTITLPGGRVMRLDEFEFGPEKITLICNTDGIVQLTVSAVKNDLKTATFSIMLEAHPTKAEDGDEARAEVLASRLKAEARLPAGQNIAKDLLLEEVDAWETLGDTWAVARARIALGDWYYARSLWEAARREYGMAKDLCGEFARCRVEAVNNMGSASRNLGDVDESAEQLGEAAEGWQKLGLPQFEAITLSNSGLLHLQTGEFSPALVDFEKARALLINTTTSKFLATLLNNIGLVYLALERYRDALSYFEQAWAATSEDADELKIQGRVRINIGHAHMLVGMLTAARHDEDVALRLASRASDISGQADALDNSGQIEYRLGHLAAAENLFRQALAALPTSWLSAWIQQHVVLSRLTDGGTRTL